MSPRTWLVLSTVARHFASCITVASHFIYSSVNYMQTPLIPSCSWCGYGTREWILNDGFGEEVEEAGGAWSTENAFDALEDSDWLEYVLAAEVAEAEALEPRTLAEDKRRPNWPHWEEAIAEELATLKKAGTWRLEEPPRGANTIRSK
ncbi:hypothetical protein EDB84DRAFT_915059 [Lactarius hengduanensis]|nr:hypothetical protein EDB84DRAFT_915059 [Lactarius hengduanensis]